MLAYPKFKLNSGEIEALLADFLPFTEVAEVPDGLPVPAGLQDPDDAVFIHLAIQSKADALVSGDAHLLQLIDAPLSILSPADFLARYIE